jgi:hypothetical protein
MQISIHAVKLFAPWKPDRIILTVLLIAAPSPFRLTASYKPICLIL